MRPSSGYNFFTPQQPTLDVIRAGRSCRPVLTGKLGLAQSARSI
jgi:hypothetical protein